MVCVFFLSRRYLLQVQWACSLSAVGRVDLDFCADVLLVMEISVDLRDLQLLAQVIGSRCSEVFLEGPELACDNWEKDGLPMWLVDAEVWSSAVLREKGPERCQRDVAYVRALSELVSLIWRAGLEAGERLGDRRLAGAAQARLSVADVKGWVSSEVVGAVEGA